MCRHERLRAVASYGGSACPQDESHSCDEGMKKGLPRWLQPIPKLEKIKEYKLPYLGGWKPQDGRDAWARLGMSAPGTRERIPVVAIVSTPPIRERVRSSRPASRARPTITAPRSQRDALRRAYIDWLKGRACMSQNGQHYLIKSAKGEKLRSAPWSALVRSTYPKQADFHTAAHAWQSPRNARTLSTH